MENEPGLMERYAAAVRSGAYPETHPDTTTAKKGEDLYPKDEVRTYPEQDPDLVPRMKHKSLKASIIMLLASFGISASMLYKVFNTEPVDSPVVEAIQYEEAEQLEASTTGITEPYIEPPEPAVTANDVALAQIEAWERVQNQLIKEFFESKSLATRALCISMGSKSKCASLEPGGNAAKAQKLLESLK